MEKQRPHPIMALHGKRFLWLRELRPGVHELVIHPSRMGPDWAGIVGDFNAMFRLGDYQYWSDPQTRALAEELGIIFTGYRELQELQGRKMGIELIR